jgi:tetratricopeptide (TPR) repeat protein
MADANDQMGHSDRALRYATEAIAAADESFGPDHPVTATMIVNHGVQLLGLFRDDEAAVELARGLELLRSEYGDTYPKIGIICLNFVQLFQRREQAAVADVYLAWAERVAAANDDARLRMSVVMWRGLSLMLAGELERSLPLLERAAELAHAIDPHVEQKLRRDIGYVQLDLGRPAAAMESLLASHALAAAADNLGEVSVTKLAMAHASRALGRRAEGRRLAMEALHVAEVADDEVDAAEARAWLAKQGVRVPARRPGEK